MDISALPWDCIVILLALAILVPWRGVARIQDLLSRSNVTSSDRITIYGSTILFQWIVAGLTLWRTEVHGWSRQSLGLVLSNPATALGVGGILALLVAALQLASLRQISHVPQHSSSYQMLSKLMPQTSAELPPFIFLVVTVSICEEFLYRGFAFTALARLFGGSALTAVVGSAAIFSFGHLYQGRSGLIMTFLLGCTLASVRAWTGTLIPCMFAHLVIDLIAGIAGPRFLKKRIEEGR